MAKTYKTLGAVLQALADGRHMKSGEVSERVLRAKIWVSGSGSPGCLYDNGPNYSRSKASAIADLAFMADDGENGVPRGMVTALHRDHCFSHDHVRYEISQTTVGSIL